MIIIIIFVSVGLVLWLEKHSRQPGEQTCWIFMIFKRWADFFYIPHRRPRSPDSFQWYTRQITHAIRQFLYDLVFIPSFDLRKMKFEWTLAVAIYLRTVAANWNSNVSPSSWILFRMRIVVFIQRKKINYFFLFYHNNVSCSDRVGRCSMKTDKSKRNREHLFAFNQFLQHISFLLSLWLIVDW